MNKYKQMFFYADKSTKGRDDDIMPIKGSDIIDVIIHNSLT